MENERKHISDQLVARPLLSGETLWPFLIAIAISIGLWGIARDAEKERLRGDLDRSANGRTIILQELLKNDLEAAQAVARFVTVQPNTSEADFREFTKRTIQGHESILAIDWAVKSHSAARPTEENVRFEIRATEPESFTPLVTDPYSLPERRLAMDEAARTRREHTTPPISSLRLSQRRAHEDALFVFLPQIEEGEDSIIAATSPRVKGFIVLLIDLTAIFQKLERDFPRAVPDILLHHESGAQRKIIFSKASSFASEDILRERRTFSFAGENFTIEYLENSYFRSEFQTGRPLLTLLFSLITSLSSASYLVLVRRKARQLAEQESWFHELAARAPIGIYRCDENGNCQYVNKSWCSITGVSYEQALGFGWEQAIHEEDRARVSETWESAVASKGEFRLDYRYKRPSGDVVWVTGAAGPIESAPGQISGYVGTIFDITEARNNRAALAVAAQAREQFLLNMAHEIRTPLTSVIGLSEELWVRNLSERDRDNAIVGIRASADHLLNIVNEILDFSKIDPGKLKIFLAPVDLFQIVHFVSAVVQPILKKKNIPLRIQYHFPLPHSFTSDATRLKQILLNLAGNAAKFTLRGEVTIEIRFNGTNERLSFSVTDTGIGIDDSLKAELFNSFIQGPDSSSLGGGTGLGLAISRKLANALDGDITFESSVGKGSTFTFSIPIHAPYQLCSETPAASLQEEISDGAGEVSAPRGRILIAEDNDLNRALISRLIAREGYDVRAVTNGAEAVTAAFEEPFDLVFLDLQMPVLDGVAALKAIHEQRPRLPIFAITAGVTAERREQLRASGFRDVLGKPFTISDLRKVLETTNWTNTTNEVDDLESLRAEYRVQLPTLITQLFTTFEERDFSKLKREAHNLGSAGMFGFPNISKSALELERIAESRDEARARVVLAELQSAVAHLVPRPSEVATMSQLAGSAQCCSVKNR